jgi:hypothetical protein
VNTTINLLIPQKGTLWAGTVTSSFTQLYTGITALS